MNAAPDFDDRWLDDLLSTPPEPVSDEGFTARVMIRVRLRRWLRPATLGGLGALGILLAARFTSTEALASILPADGLARVLESLPALGAVDYTSPVALTIVAAALLVWLVEETA